MDRKAIKDFVYGGMAEILKNRDYYYHSNVGASYSHFTEQGKDAMVEFMEMVAFKMKEADEAELNKRSKELIIKGLKGESV